MSLAQHPAETLFNALNSFFDFLKISFDFWYERWLTVHIHVD